MHHDIILFDLDGTLTDSGPGIMKAGQYAPARVRHRARLARAVVLRRPAAQRDLRALCPSAENVDAAVAKFREYYQQDGWLDNAPIPAFPLACASQEERASVFSSPRRSSTPWPSAFWSTSVLRPISTPSAARPRATRRRAKKVNVVKAALKAASCNDLSRAVMVGDREHDVIGAHLAGLDVIGVLYGYGSREELTAAGADQIAETPEALETLICQQTDILKGKEIEMEHLERSIAGGIALHPRGILPPERALSPGPAASRVPSTATTA